MHTIDIRSVKTLMYKYKHIMYMTIYKLLMKWGIQ